jgi:hypothetical protein
MQKLKLLPWLARRHGVPLERAEEQWRQAVARADFEHGLNAQTSDYWACAVHTLLKLLRADGAAWIEAEALEQPFELSTQRSASPLIDSQRRLGIAAFDAAEAFLHAANEYWNRALRVANARR